MKKIASAGIAILLFASLLFPAGCSISSTPKVKANKKVLELIKTWDPKIAFYTSKKNPLKTIENLRQDEIACFGPELADKIKAFYDAAGTERTYGNAVQMIAPADLSFSAKDSPRLYITWIGNGPKLKDAVKVTFSEKG